MSQSGEKSVAVSDAYYWKDYDGTIPADAFIAGISGGKRIYAGKAFIKEVPAEIPGSLYEGDPTLYTCAKGYIRKSKESVKILCVPAGETRVCWYPIKQSQLNQLPKGVKPIYGGVEKEKNVRVGRKVRTTGEAAVGKIWGLLETVTQDGKLKRFKETFDLLATVE